MQIVINVSKTLKDIADEDDFKTFSHFMWQTILMDALKNGVVLPETHGRLIDADALKLKQKHSSNEFHENVVSVAEIDWLDTIVEASEG